jgi:hypothetical protein
VARGLVFLILSYFAVLAATGATARPIDSKEALHQLLSQPFGEFLLAVMAAGLLCFGLWRLAQLLIDPDCYGTDTKGLTRRGIYGLAGLFYIGFAAVAALMILGAASSVPTSWCVTGRRGSWQNQQDAGLSVASVWLFLRQESERALLAFARNLKSNWHCPRSPACW